MDDPLDALLWSLIVIFGFGVIYLIALGVNFA